MRLWQVLENMQGVPPWRRHCPLPSRQKRKDRCKQCGTYYCVHGVYKYGCNHGCRAKPAIVSNQRKVRQHRLFWGQRKTADDKRPPAKKYCHKMCKCRIRFTRCSKCPGGGGSLCEHGRRKDQTCIECMRLFGITAVRFGIKLPADTESDTCHIPEQDGCFHASGSASDE